MAKTTAESLGRVPKGPPAKPHGLGLRPLRTAGSGAVAGTVPPDVVIAAAHFRRAVATGCFYSASRPAPQDATDLDNKMLPLDLQKQFEASGVGFPSGASIQGASAALVDQRLTPRVHHQTRAEQAECLSIAGAARVATTQDPRESAPGGEAAQQTESG